MDWMQTSSLNSKGSGLPVSKKLHDLPGPKDLYLNELIT